MAQHLLPQTSCRPECFRCSALVPATVFDSCKQRGHPTEIGMMISPAMCSWLDLVLICRLDGFRENVRHLPAPRPNVRDGFLNQSLTPWREQDRKANIMLLSSSCGRYLSDNSWWTTADCAWKSLHLRRYRHDAHMSDAETLPFIDHLVVLVTGGATLFERRIGGHWKSAGHVVGHISTVEPGDSCKLRWHGDVEHETLQLHLPITTMETAIEELRDERLPSQTAIISSPDPLVSQVMRSLVEAASAGVSDLYAESAGHLLARHLLTRSPPGLEPKTNDAIRLHRVEEYMRANLARNITLADMAEIAGCSPFQLLRRSKSLWGETPFQRLTALRMELACTLLRQADHGVTSVAFDCGYSNPSHFAIAFRRAIGISPSEYRMR
jgi:AraC family transcriptional regulator